MFESVAVAFASPIIRILVCVIAVSAPLGTYYWGKSAGWDTGFEAGKLAQNAEYWEKYTEKEQEIGVLNEEIRLKNTELEQEKKRVGERVVTNTKIVEKIVYDNPDFAATRRPADLDALRLQELREISKAVGPSAD